MWTLFVSCHCMSCHTMPYHIIHIIYIYRKNRRCQCAMHRGLLVRRCCCSTAHTGQDLPFGMKYDSAFACICVKVLQRFSARTACSYREGTFLSPLHKDILAYFMECVEERGWAFLRSEALTHLHSKLPGSLWLLFLLIWSNLWCPSCTCPGLPLRLKLFTAERT